MPQPYVVPLTCPQCGRPVSVTIQQLSTLGQRVTAPKGHPVRCPYAGCDGRIEPVIRGEIVSVLMSDGPGHESAASPTLDSDLTAVNSVFREMDRAVRFLRMARSYPSGPRRNGARDFAQSAHDIVVKFLGRGRVSDNDRRRLTEESAALQKMLDEFSA